MSDSEKTKEGSEPSLSSLKINKLQKIAISQVTDRFLRNVRSLQLACKQIVATLDGNSKEQAVDLSNFLRDLGVDFDAAGNKSITVHVSKATELVKRINSVSIATSARGLSLRGLFLVLISEWDAYVTSILRWVYDVRPELIHNSERGLTFRELRGVGSVDDACNMIVESEIFSIMREGHADQVKKLESLLKVTLRGDGELWSAFVEITQRRNLIAHSDGAVTSQYIENCLANDVRAHPVPKLGEKIKVDVKYFSMACDTVSEFGVKLSQVIWRKQEKDDVKRAESHLLATTFEMIEAGQYCLAIKILDFALRKPMTFTNSRSRFMCVVNLAQAHKWHGNAEKCSEIIDGEDWSSASIDFELSVAVLRDDFSLAGKIMKKIGADGSITKADYDNWPIFVEFKKSDQFLASYKAVFKTDVEVRDVSGELDVILDVSAQAEGRSKQRRRKGHRSNR